MLSFEESVFLNKAKMIFKVVNHLIPEYVCHLFERRLVDSLNMSLRSISNCNQIFNIPNPHLTKFNESMPYSGLVFRILKVNSFAYLFNCTTVGRTSD